MSTMERVVVPDVARVAEYAASVTAQALQEAVARRGVARLVLTGGTAGIATAAALRSCEVPWSEVEVYFGDERFVAQGHPERNDAALAEALVDHIQPRSVTPFPALGEMFGDDVEAAAIASGRALAALPPLDGEGLLFDVHLLGMGGEGHINSLFPHSPATTEDHHLVMPVTDCPKPPPTRISLTFPAIHRTAHVLLVVAGADKAQAVAAARAAGTERVDIPASAALGRESTTWVIDSAAAAEG